MQAQILDFPYSRYRAPASGRRIDVDLCGIFDDLAHADDLSQVMVMAKVLANALYACNGISEMEWRNILSIFEMCADERRLP